MANDYVIAGSHVPPGNYIHITGQQHENRNIIVLHTVQQLTLFFVSLEGSILLQKGDEVRKSDEFCQSMQVKSPDMEASIPVICTR